MVNFSSISGPYDWVITVNIVDGDEGVTLQLERIDADGTVLAPVTVTDGQTITLAEAMPQGLFQGDFTAHWTAQGGCVEIESTYEFVE
jgi:hypothetical protein